MSILCGIDPGRNGAIAIFDTETMRVTCHDMPDTTAGLHDLIAGLPIVKVCALEKPFYPQMIGITNATKIAEAYGILRGALQWRDIPVREVRPSEWKRALNLGTSKAASREKAGQFFPDDAEQFKRVRDDGRAEAALLAWYGLRWTQKNLKEQVPGSE